MKIFWGAADGNLTGSRRFFAILGISLVVHAAFATLLAAAPRHEGTLGQTKLGPLARTLHEHALHPPPHSSLSVASFRNEVGQVTFVDSHGIRYLIPDMRQLDARSRRVLDRFL